MIKKHLYYLFILFAQIALFLILAPIFLKTLSNEKVKTELKLDRMSIINQLKQKFKNGNSINNSRFSMKGIRHRPRMIGSFRDHFSFNYDPNNEIYNSEPGRLLNIKSHVFVKKHGKIQEYENYYKTIYQFEKSPLIIIEGYCEIPDNPEDTILIQTYQREILDIGFFDEIELDDNLPKIAIISLLPKYKSELDLDIRTNCFDSLEFLSRITSKYHSFQKSGVIYGTTKIGDLTLNYGSRKLNLEYSYTKRIFNEIITEDNEKVNRLYDSIYSGYSPIKYILFISMITFNLVLFFLKFNNSFNISPSIMKNKN